MLRLRKSQERTPCEVLIFSTSTRLIISSAQVRHRGARAREGGDVHDRGGHLRHGERGAELDRAGDPSVIVFSEIHVVKIRTPLNLFKKQKLRGSWSTPRMLNIFVKFSVLKFRATVTWRNSFRMSKNWRSHSKRSRMVESVASKE